ncbi:MAG TPA: hypothetical protein PLM58_07720 [Novosphingobium sp.]|uniref:hypothetical protein n=1 Tax=Novosphingobium sp. 28-62-57 TaxID=1970409 RepID=UPI0025FB7904|nr:hypothetical protein [Novosphingobium sp. 28-62-57]HQS69502.1 hypothetical protein [Novosphingobium sp.]
MTFLAFDVGNETHATSVMFVTRIVEALNLRKSHFDDRPTFEESWQKKTKARESKRREAIKIARSAPMTAGKLFCNRAGQSAARLKPEM